MNPLKFFWGLVTVLLGLVLISTNAGWISTGIWWSILMLWPVVLIVLGLKLLLHNNDRLFMWLALVAVLLSAAYVVAVNQNKWQASFLTRSHMNIGTNVSSENLADNFDVASVKKLKLSISTGAAEVSLHVLPSGTAADVLYKVRTQDMGKLAVERTVSGDVVSLNIDEQSAGLQVGPGMVGFDRQIEISLPSSLLLALDLSSGASKLSLDFSLLKPEQVNLRVGASSGEIVFSNLVARQGFTLDAGASSLSFKVPADLGVKATLGGGLNNVSTDSSLGFVKSGDVYTTGDFDKALNQLTLTGGVGVSNIKFLQK